LAAAPVLRTARGERLIIRLTPGFGPVRSADQVGVAALTAGVLALCNLPGDRIDWYIRHDDSTVNAYAAGRRSIALSSGLLRACTAGELSVDEVVGVLVHEVGHLLDPISRRRLIVAWLTGPWCLLQTLLVRMARVVARRAPGGRAGLLLFPVIVAVAVVQLSQARAWGPLVGIIGLVVAVGVAPVIDAAMSRRAELAADQYAASVGEGDHLATVLTRIATAHPARGARLYAHHPPASLRIERLTAQS
jgi:Zn-dependent protease with chaperone function